MTIYLDISAAVHHRAGLGRYAENLTRALLAIEPDRYSLFYNRERGVQPLQGMENVPARSVALGYKPWRMLIWLGQLTRIRFNRLLPGVRLFHAMEHLLPPLQGVPTVLTVHDLIFRYLPEHHKPLNRWYLNATMPLYCHRATHIITVSECTRRDVIAAYHVPPQKITVVHEAADPQFRPQSPEAVASARSRYGLPERYLLSVGTIEPRKNLARLLTAFESVCNLRLSDSLVIVGRRGWLYDDFFAQLEQSPVRDRVIFPGYVPNDDLPAIYAGAQALAFPSLYEGFGLPVLEAMACGVPVVCSNTSSLPEVAGDAALQFDPHDVQSIREALTRLLSDEELQRSLRARGRVQAGKFRWTGAASKTRAVYDLILNGSRSLAQ